jgi:hypothetical protein
LAGRIPAATDANLKEESRMRFRPVLFVLPLAMFAQTAPPEVDQALRARVNEFFQYHVTGDFEKAWGMVAEDTKKEYFSGQKTRYESFKIDSIKYMENFTKAMVTLTVQEKKRMSVQFPELVMTEPTSTLWKIENGKWCWYNEHATNWLMPMGPSDPKAVADARTKAQSGTPALTPEKLQEQARTILSQSSLDKPELKLASNKESSDQAVFRNGQGGAIKLALLPASLPPGMTAKLDKTDVGANEQAILKVTYTPGSSDKAPADVPLSVLMEPFGRVFPLVVRFAPAH